MSRGTQDPASSPIRFWLQGFHLLWPAFPRRSPTSRIGNSTPAVLQPPAPPCKTPTVSSTGALQRGAGFGLFRFRSPLLTESRLLSLPPGTEMVHFPGLARTRLCIQRAVPAFCAGGFPHSDIPGSKPACGSPRLIAASHVLLRLLAPRHSPYALSSLTTKLTQLSPMNSTATDDNPPPCGGFPPRGRSSRTSNLVAFHKSALLPRTVCDTPEKRFERQLPPQSHTPGATQ